MCVFAGGHACARAKITPILCDTAGLKPMWPVITLGPVLWRALYWHCEQIACCSSHDFCEL